jgi:hypothetical protein
MALPLEVERGFVRALHCRDRSTANEAGVGVAGKTADIHDFFRFAMTVNVRCVPCTDADLVGVLKQREGLLLVKYPSLPVWRAVGHGTAVARLGRGC